MNENKDRILMGLLFIIAGILFFGETMGQYNFNFALFIRNYWPVLLIIYGLHVLLQNSKFWFLVPLLLIVLSAYLIYYLINYQPMYISPNFRERIFDFNNLPFR